MVKHEGGFTSSSGPLPGAETYANLVSLPVSKASVGRYVIPALEPLDLLGLSFAMTDGSGETGTVRVWGLRPVRYSPSVGDARHGQREDYAQEFLGFHLLDLSLTAGANAKDGSSKVFSENGVVFASAIVATVDNLPSPGFRTVGASPSPSFGFFDGMGFPYYVMEVRVGTAASICPIWFQF